MEGRIVIGWPEIQYLYNQRGFFENSTLIMSGPDYDRYGDAAYYVSEEWLNGLCDELKKMIGYVPQGNAV